MAIVPTRQPDCLKSPFEEQMQDARQRAETGGKEEGISAYRQIITNLFEQFRHYPLEEKPKKTADTMLKVTECHIKLNAFYIVDSYYIRCAQSQLEIMPNNIEATGAESAAKAALYRKASELCLEIDRFAQKHATWVLLDKPARAKNMHDLAVQYQTLADNLAKV